MNHRGIRKMGLLKLQGLVDGCSLSFERSIKLFSFMQNCRLSVGKKASIRIGQISAETVLQSSGEWQVFTE